MVDKNPNKKRCIKCGSTQVHYRIIPKEFVCHSCGHIEKDKNREDRKCQT